MGKRRKRRKRRPSSVKTPTSDRRSTRRSQSSYCDPIWERSPFTQRTGNRVVNKIDCFECVECGLEWRAEIDHRGGMSSQLAFTCSRTDCDNCVNDEPCKDGACPSCGSSYVFWLSFDIRASSVYLTNEWITGERTFPGEIHIRRQKSAKAV